MYCSDLNASIAAKALSYRNEASRLRTIVNDQKNVLRDSEAFVDSIFLDGKWEKRLICSGESCIRITRILITIDILTMAIYNSTVSAIIILYCY
jgi:hypothetical protein